MPSPLAQKVAGTFIADSVQSLSTVSAWLAQECRHGSLAEHVKRFVEIQPECLDQSLVLADSITSDCVHLRIPVKLYDHEANGTFESEVRFTLNPVPGKCQRADAT